MILAGDFIQASGEWSNNRTHGVQFRARFLKAMPPAPAEGIQKYLGSGDLLTLGAALSATISAADLIEGF
jgi:exodeoxyribonuclease V alpha subunit